MMLVARIDYALTRGINWLTTCLAERARGYSSSEAGDFLDTLKPDAVKCSYCPTFDGIECALNCDCERRAYFRQKAEQETDPSYIESPRDWRHITGGPPVPQERFTLEDIYRLKNAQYDVCGFCFHMRCQHERPYTGACSAFVGPQTPAAAQRGESSPTASEPPELAVGLSDPSPTIASRQHQPSVRDEGSPLDSAIPPAPRGEHPAEKRYTLDEWIAWATPAIVEVLAEHRTIGGTFVDGTAGKVNCITFTSVHMVCGNWQAWREHVAPFIAARIKADAAQADRPSTVEIGHDASHFAREFFPQSQK